MRILVVTTWFPSAERPGQAPFILKHAQAIARLHDVAVIHVRRGVASRPTMDHYEGLRVLRLPLDSRRPWLIVRMLNRVQRAAADADIIHTMAFSSALIAATLLPFTRQRWVHTEHWSGVRDPMSVSRLWTVVSGAVCRVLALPDWRTAVSRNLADAVARFGGEARTSVVPCVVENPLPVTSPPGGPRLRLIAVGGLVDGKRPVLAVRTLRWLIDQGRDASLVWVGDGPLRSEMELERRSLGVEERVVLAGVVKPADVFQRLREADLFFLPTRGETFLVSAAEALSAGRPVVTTRVGGIGDYADESNSVLVDEASPESFGHAILRAHERFASVPAEELALPIRERLSPDRIGRRFDAIYRRLMEESPPRR